MTSEVEVKVRSEVKFEVRSSKRISRCTSIQNFRFLALKMTELWLFEIKSLTYGTYTTLLHATLVTFKSNSKSDKVDLANNIVFSFVPREITQSFFELQTPDLAWKLEWIFRTN